jgi:hypothetical protein
VSNVILSPPAALIRNIGGLVGGLPDRYPHFGVLYLSDTVGNGRDIHTEQLTGTIAVSDSFKEESVQGGNKNVNRQSKGGIFRIFSGSRTPRPESSDLYNVHQVSLEASECHEYLLLNDEEWVSSVYSSPTVRACACAWSLEKLKVEKKVYLIVGYLTYLDVKVSNETNSEMDNNRSTSPLVPVSAIVGTPVSFSNSRSGRSASSGLSSLFIAIA